MKALLQESGHVLPEGRGALLRAHREQGSLQLDVLARGGPGRDLVAGHHVGSEGVGYVKRLKASNPAAAPALAVELGKHDYGQVYRSNIKGSGRRKTDAADAPA